jgi:hypothetical protein
MIVDIIPRRSSTFPCIPSSFWKRTDFNLSQSIIKFQPENLTIKVLLVPQNGETTSDISDTKAITAKEIQNHVVSAEQ